MKYSFSQYKAMSKPAKASLWFLISAIIINGARFLATPVHTRIMSQVDYGIIGVFNAWQAAFNVIATLSLSAAVFNNGLLEYGNDRAIFTSSLLILSSISSGISYIFFLLFHETVCAITHLTNLQLNVMFLGFLLNPAFAYWAAEQRFEYKYEKLVVVTVLTAIVSQVVAIIAVIYTEGDKASSLIVTNGLVNIAVGSVFYVHLLYRSKCRCNLKYWRYVLAFNLPLIPHYLSFFVLGQSDRVIIADLVSDDKAGIYTLGYTAATILQVVYAAINASWSPFTLKKMQENDLRAISKTANAIIVIYGAISITLIGFATEIIQALGPGSYREAAYVISPVVIGLYFFILAGFFTNIEFFYKKTLYIMLSTIASATLNITLNYIFIPRLGFLIAAYTTIVCYFLYMIVHYFIMHKLDDREIYDVPFFSKFTLAFLSFSVGLILLADLLWARVILIFIIALIVILNKASLRQKCTFDPVGENKK